MKEKAVVLLSGGIDSVTTLYLAKKHGFRCECLIFDYGQRHRKEVNRAKKIARLADCGYRVLKVNLPWKGSALLDKKMKIPFNKRFGIRRRIPATYVPSRNTIFLSYAASFAETIGAKKVFIGANVIDYSGYPDCRPAYLASFNRMLRRGTKKKDISVIAPLINKSKHQIVKLAGKLGAPLMLTWSCYRGGRFPCGACDSCRIRALGFKKAGTKDPALE